jgi:hypothetical protein
MSRGDRAFRRNILKKYYDTIGRKTKTDGLGDGKMGKRGNREMGIKKKVETKPDEISRASFTGALRDRGLHSLICHASLGLALLIGLVGCGETPLQTKLKVAITNIKEIGAEPSSSPCFSSDDREIYLEKGGNIVAIDIAKGSERNLMSLDRFDTISRKGAGSLPGAFCQHVAQMAASGDGGFLAISFSEAGGQGLPPTVLVIQPLEQIPGFVSAAGYPKGTHPAFDPSSEVLVYTSSAGLVERKKDGSEHLIIDNVADETSTFFSWPEFTNSTHLLVAADYVHLYEITLASDGRAPSRRKIVSFDSPIHGIAAIPKSELALVLVGEKPDNSNKARLITNPSGVVATEFGTQKCRLLLVDLLYGKTTPIDLGSTKLEQSINFAPWGPRVSPRGGRIALVAFDDLKDPHVVTGELVFENK